MSAAASSSPAPKASPTIAEILEILLVCFEAAAADAFPYYDDELLVYAQNTTTHVSGHDVYIVWRL